MDGSTINTKRNLHFNLICILTCRLITPNPMVDMFEKPGFGATKFEQDTTSLKYTIDITGFDTDAIKVLKLRLHLCNIMKFEENEGKFTIF